MPPIDYDALFSNMLDGFSLCEMIWDEEGNGVNFRYLMINPAFTKLTGLVDPVGKTVKELIPGIEQWWIDTYAKVVKTGVAACVEHEVVALGMTFTVVAYQTGSNHFGAVFTNITQRRTTERALKQVHKKLESAYADTILGWSRALDLRDEETEGHSQRVTVLTMKLCTAIGMKGKAIEFIRYGALLHDVGKIGIPDMILRKPGPLTGDEWDIMRQHPSIAYDLLSPIVFLRPSLNIPLYHHEKWDGSGYPYGLENSSIPIEARVFAVIDVWDALTNARVYRPAMSREQALAIIIKSKSTHFDPVMADQFVSMIRGSDEHNA